MVIKTTEHLPQNVKKRRGEISIEEFRGRIRLRWRYNNRRYYLAASAYTTLNLIIAQKAAIQIEYDIAINNFDYQLLRYRSIIRQTTDSVDKVHEYFSEWVYETKHRVCFDVNHYYVLYLVLKRWGHVTEDNFLNKLKNDSLSNKTFNSRLGVFNSFAQWLVRRSLWKYNPLEGVSRKREETILDPRRKPFTRNEVHQILEAFKTDKFIAKHQKNKHSFYYSFLYFLLKTGVRNGEAIGLRVGSVDFDKKVVIIKEVLARKRNSSNGGSRIRKETKNCKERRLPLSVDLETLLMPLCINKKNDDLVFQSPNGLPIDDNKFQKYNFKPVLKKLNISHRILYACRHTFASRCIENGYSAVNTALLMGNNPETTLRNYVHQTDIPKKLPDF